MPTLATDLLVLGGRFRLLRLLGEGGMGVVWEVEERQTGRHRAIKFVKNDTQSPSIEKRFLREAETANAIRHPNILPIDEVAFDDDGTPAFVMELLRGESLATRIERDRFLTVGQTAAILKQVVDALSAAHAGGVVHRDLKPDNVFITLGSDGSVRVRVLDFGIARKFDLPTETLTITGTLVGTPLYMSPEQAAGERGLDPRTDVWSLGVIAFECLTGTTPATGENYGQILSRLIRADIVRLSDLPISAPDDLREAIDGLLVERTRRKADLASFHALLDRWADAQITPPMVLGPASESDPTIQLQSQPRIRVESETIGATTNNVTVGRSYLAPIVGVLVVLGAAGIVMGTIGWKRSKQTVIVPAALATTSAAPVTSVSSEDSSSLMTLPPPPHTSTAMAEPPASAASIAKKPTAASPPRPPPRPPAPTGSNPVRLQGGVAGDVPF